MIGESQTHPQQRSIAHQWWKSSLMKNRDESLFKPTRKSECRKKYICYLSDSTSILKASSSVHTAHRVPRVSQRATRPPQMEPSRLSMENTLMDGQL
ncbi:hypothetical protein SFRURICE_007757 [Spodoptera frugiperda]|uniref:SFRICE_024897 n=1 Tax=Spodoptera frugiperda TaxID=7108 RepID=A0A2H1WX22_SPOFR|nr:hypothetical protein SFRURICE_007757 [Spodoptera frugiperda]